MIAHPISVRIIAIAALPFTFTAAFADTGRTQTGIASVYSYHGSKTASGERANKHGLTAAHRSLPFGTRVKVTNKKNGKSVVVRINDRGPFIKGRIIDLTPQGASALSFSGLAPVSVAVVN
jgi:rare lipoprotein A